MTLKDVMTSDLADVFYDTDEFGYTVTYTPNGQAPTSTVIIPVVEDPSLTDPDVMGDSINVRIQSSFFETILAGLEPGRGDSLVWGTTTWYVIGKIGGGSHIGEYEIEISRSEKRLLT